MSPGTALIPPTLTNILLAVVAGGLLALGWPPATSFYVLLFAWVPLLLLSDRLKTNTRSLFAFASLVALVLLIWNVYTTQWIYGVYFTSGVAVSFINVSIFTIPWVLYHYAKGRLPYYYRYGLLVSSWLSIELMHYYWGFAFPFLNLGNGLATVPSLAQWYEYTGVFGGSLWIWIVNISLYNLLKSWLAQHKRIVVYRRLLVATTCIAVPIGCSLFIYATYSSKGKKVEVVAVHTDLECSTERREYSQDSLLTIYWKATAGKLSSNTEYIIWPETSLDLGWIEELSDNKQLQTIVDSLQKYPKANLITGSVLYEKLQSTSTNESLPNASYLSDFDIWYNTYNAAVQVNASSGISFRTKVNLVPLEETTTYPVLINFLRQFIPTLGGYKFSTRSVNDDIFKGKSVESATLICYEVLFGNTVTKYSHLGADILFLILNEGWIDDDQQAKQFLSITSLRAIEARRSIVKVSNKGITAFVDQRGLVTSSTSDPGSSPMISEVKSNKRNTFYTQWGDYIGWVSLIVFAVQLSLLAVKLFSVGLLTNKKVLVHN